MFFNVPVAIGKFLLQLSPVTVRFVCVDMSSLKTNVVTFDKSKPEFITSFWQFLSLSCITDAFNGVDIVGLIQYFVPQEFLPSRVVCLDEIVNFFSPFRKGKPSFPVPDEYVTDNGLVTLARSAFGSPVKHDAENLSLYEDQAFVQQLFTYQELGYPNVAIIELGYPFHDLTREEVINTRLTMVLSAVVSAPQQHAERLLSNTLRSLQNIKELSPRSIWKVRELVDFIAQRPAFKEIYFELFQDQLKLLEKRKFADAPDSKPSKRRITTPQTP